LIWDRLWLWLWRQDHGSCEEELNSWVTGRRGRVAGHGQCACINLLIDDDFTANNEFYGATVYASIAPHLFICKVDSKQGQLSHPIWILHR
jgi:hypothetical protein